MWCNWSKRTTKAQSQVIYFFSIFHPVLFVVTFGTSHFYFRIANHRPNWLKPNVSSASRVAWMISMYLLNCMVDLRPNRISLYILLFHFLQTSIEIVPIIDGKTSVLIIIYSDQNSLVRQSLRQSIIFQHEISLSISLNILFWWMDQLQQSQDMMIC